MKISFVSTGVSGRFVTSTSLAIFLLINSGKPVQGGVVSTGNSNPNQSQTSFGAPGPSADELLAKVRASAERVYINMTNFVCNEQIERFKGNAHSSNGRKVDVITSEVSYDHETEHYSKIQQNNKPLSSIGGLTGAWSEGEYGTVLRETVKALASRNVKFMSMTPLDGKQAAVFTFDYSSKDSPWDIVVSGHHYTIPFRGQIWASPTTGDILRIDRIARDMPTPTGIFGVNWVIGFGPMQADSKSFWLPTNGVYSVSYCNSDRHEWNVIAFSGYKRYGSDVVVHFQ